MLKRMSLDERFIAWLETKDPSEKFSWQDGRNCACAQFIKESFVSDRDAMVVWGRFDQIAFESGYETRSWTFGALLELTREFLHK